MYSYRVSKFNPRSSVVARRAEWTSISDVGARFSGEPLTLEDYEAVEAKYLEALRLMLLEAGVPSFRITDVSPSSVASTASAWIHEGLTVDVDGAVSVTRAQLREELSCHLQAENGFSVDTGFDYYVYVTSPTPLVHSVGHIGELGLYVEEEVTSPYFDA